MFNYSRIENGDKNIMSFSKVSSMKRSNIFPEDINSVIDSEYKIYNMWKSIF